MTDQLIFPIRFSLFNAVLQTPFGAGPRRAYVAVDDRSVQVRMGLAFRAEFSRSGVVDAGRRGYVWWAYGVHGGGGRLIVNGSGHNMVWVRLDPPVEARVYWAKVPLKELWVSLKDPDGFLRAIGR